MYFFIKYMNFGFQMFAKTTLENTSLVDTDNSTYGTTTPREYNSRKISMCV